MPKFTRLAQLLQDEGLVSDAGFAVPELADCEMLHRVHRPAYVDAVLDQTVPRAVEREIGLPISATVARRAQAACGGTLMTARLALEHGVACNTAGGSHHASTAQGAGFCVFNDVGVAIRRLQRERAVRRFAVIDCDVHQGDGTAEIFAGDDSVVTLSVHAERNYPVRKVPSDLDVALPDGLGDDAYLEVIEAAVPDLLDRFRPDLVFYNAGVDPHWDDRLGRLALSDEGLLRREEAVLGACSRRGIAVAGVLGGGYAADVDTLAQRHAILHRTASELASRSRQWI